MYVLKTALDVYEQVYEYSQMIKLENTGLGEKKQVEQSSDDTGSLK